MIPYIFRRILMSIPVLFGILTITFFVVRLAPGDPVALYENPQIDPAALQRLRIKYGLDQPLHIQYVKWLRSIILEGEFGISFVHKRPVIDILKKTIPNTLLLSAVAIVLNLILGIFIGTLSAIRQYSLLDHTATLLALIIYSIPGFWLGLMLIILFAYVIPIFPPSHMTSINADLFSPLGRILDLLHHMILPAFVLGIAAAASTARYMRSSLLEVVRQDYIRTARAKGLPEYKVVFKHAMRNALLPILTLLGLYMPFLLGGALITEVVFAWPGMGRVTYDAIIGRDYPLVIANTFVASCMVILGNLLADISYAVADPRIRLE